MKTQWLTLFFGLLLFTGESKAQDWQDNEYTRGGRMRALFQGFEEVVDPKTRRKEYFFDIVFIDLAPKAALKRLRHGEQFAGYTVGEFIKREPKWLPNDGYVKGTLPTLELIHTNSGKKYTLEPEVAYALPLKP